MSIKQVSLPRDSKILDLLPSYPVLPVDDTHEVETRSDVVVLRFRVI